MKAFLRMPISTNAACRPSSRFCTSPLKTLPTIRSSAGCSILKSSSLPPSSTATRVCRLSALIMICFWSLLFFRRNTDIKLNPFIVLTLSPFSPDIHALHNAQGRHCADHKRSAITDQREWDSRDRQEADRHCDIDEDMTEQHGYNPHT